MNPGNQIWILLAFVALSFLQWLIRRLTEQSAINRKKQAEARRREEILRTGRDPDQQTRQPDAASVSAEAAARQAHLRELRQKQLEEMRRKGQVRPAPNAQVRVPPKSTLGSPGNPGVPGPIATAPARGSPPPRHPSRTAPPPRSSQTAAPPRPPQTATPPRTTPAAPPRRPGSLPAQPQQASRNLPATTARRAGTEAPLPPSRTRAKDGPGKVRDTSTPQSLAATPLISEIPDAAAAQRLSSRSIGAGMTAVDWRRAIILGEVLAPPVSLRHDR